MKKKSAGIILGALITLVSLQCNCQAVFQVKYQSDAQVKIFEVQDSTTADLIIYQVSTEPQAGNNNGQWYFAGFPDNITKNIFYVFDPAIADIKVFFTGNQSSAGWVNTAKASLLN